MREEPALLATADGELFKARSVGADGVTTGEAVFNTSMTGYQEILTDPSYAGQVVVMTSPHIGNYGVNLDDDQSRGTAASGLVVRSLSRRASSWRSQGSLADYLEDRGVVALADLDTRRLTRHLRERGAMPVAMGSGVTEIELKDIAANAPTMEGLDLVSKVSTERAYHREAIGVSKGLIVAVDLGIKRDIVASLAGRGYHVEVVPARTSAADIMGLGPAGVFLPNGPGDPEPLAGPTETVRRLIGQVPIFGICLGHQVLGLAIGARTFKLPFGHHGGNHPVRRLEDGRVEVTAQNHGFAVDLWWLTEERQPARNGLVTPALLPDEVQTEVGPVRPTHQNLNDGTLEGMVVVDHPAFSVQYHPEAAPGPHDATALFDRFDRLIQEGR